MSIEATTRNTVNNNNSTVASLCARALTGSSILLFTIEMAIARLRGLNTVMHSILQGVQFSLLALAWTLYQLLKPTVIILFLALCISVFTI